MKIWRSIEEIPNEITSVVTIGNFDGMHEGHRQVIATAVARARSRGVKAVACTFDPHPRIVHNPDTALKLISPLRDRLDAMAATGLDATFVIHYDASVYSLSPREFVEKYLVSALGAVEVVVGKDFRFGRENSGDLATLTQLGQEFGFTVESVEDVEAPEGRRWSSSWVRELLEEGDVSGAARVLGHLHRIRGTVEHGYKRGRELGFPTATCAMTSKALFLEMVSTLDGLSGTSGTAARQSSFPLRFLWGRILNLMVKYVLLKRMFWAGAT